MRVGLASIGSRAQKAAGVTINKQELVESLAAFAQHNVAQRLLETRADNSGATLDWLEEKVLKPHGAHLRAEADAMVTTIRPTRLSQLKMIRLLTTKALPHMVTGS